VSESTPPTALPAAGDAVRLLAIVRTLARELRPESPTLATLGLDHRLDRDFGLDSLARVELFARVERELGVRLGEAALAGADTPRELWALIAAASVAPERHGIAGAAVGCHDAGPPAAAGTAGIDAAAHGGSSAAFEPAPAQIGTLCELLDWHAGHQRERVHLVLRDDAGGEVPLCYGRLKEIAQAVAAGLVARGTAPGSRIALMLPTGLDFFAAFYGALYAGCVPVPLYPPARPTQLEEHLRRIAAILTNAGAQWLVADPRARPFAQVLSAQCPALAGIVTVKDLALPGEKPPPVTAAPTDMAFLQYTSGSTGDPKGVVLSHANLLANIGAMRRAARVTHEDLFVSWLPLYHDMGLIGAALGSMAVGFRLVLMSPLAFLARPACWLEAIDRHRATLSAAPNFAYEICATKLTDETLAGLDLSCWRLAFNGAEGVSPATLERFAARLAPFGFRRTALTPVYGLAECSVGLAFPPPGRGPRIDRVDRRALADEARALPLSDGGAATAAAQAVVGCGHPLPEHEIRIVDAACRPLPERRVGRLEFRGPSATRGYFGNASATARLFDGDWLDSGDLGYLADGELFITGRSKDIIIRAGHNIHPQELEQAVGAIPGVRPGGVAVFAASDARSGTEKLVVLAELRDPGADARDASGRETIRAAIATLAIELTGLPADDIVLAPPQTVLKTSSGKIRRAACREAYEGGLLLQRPPPAWRQALRLAGGAFVVAAKHRLHSLGTRLWGAFALAVFAVLAPPFWLLVTLAPTLTLRRRLARTGARAVLAAAGASPQVAGLEHLTDERAVVVVANHASYLDGMVLTAVLPPRFAYIAKRELARHPLSAVPLTRLGTLFVDRDDAARGAGDAQVLATHLAAGGSLAVFAEGTFRAAPGLLPFRLGAFLAAAKAGVPVVPVTLAGTRRLFPDGARFPRPARLAVTIEAPVDPAGDDWQAALALRGAARAAILARLGEPDADA
jgi:1-acyl-sn-glycerol-3-phosphate acyltransferase